MNKNIPGFSKINKLSSLFSILLFLFVTDLRAQVDSIQTNVPALKEVYKNDFYIGCLLSYRHVGFPDDPYVPGQSAVEYPLGGKLIKFHMNSMSPGNNMKMMYTFDLTGTVSAYNAAQTQAEKDSIEVHPQVKFNGNLIAQLNWAKRQGFTFRGHTLVWHAQAINEFFYKGYSTSEVRLSKDKMIERMDNYIKEVIRLLHESWPGLLSAIDVVNEAVLDNGSDRTDSEWYKTFGDNSYIIKAFEIARKYTFQYGETQIKLYYNDYNTSASSKATGIAKVCSPIFRAGFLDGIGMQEHDGYNSPTAAQWIATYNKFDTVCTEMSVTEFDIKPSSNTLSTTVLTQQANQYAMLFKCFVERSYRSGRGKIVSVSKDGLNDASAFVANASLWDGNYQCKPAFYAAINTGINYNALDSIITLADNLKESEYTAETWSAFSIALTDAKTAKDKNYSNSMSAADFLGKAKDDLASAINNLTKNTTGIESNDHPKEFMLAQNYPNPFNPTTTIQFALPANNYVKIILYDVLGNVVKELVSGNYTSGYHKFTFNASDLASGVYLYRIETGKFVQSKKLVLMK